MVQRGHSQSSVVSPVDIRVDTGEQANQASGSLQSTDGVFQGGMFAEDQEVVVGEMGLDFFDSASHVCTMCGLRPNRPGSG